MGKTAANEKTDARRYVLMSSTPVIPWFRMAANSFLHSDTLAEFAGRFDGATLKRGRAYAGDGRVRVRRVERAPGEIHVEAEVQGTRKHPYEVDLWLELDPGGAIVDVDNSCMCPLRENCKHVVATLLNLSLIHI